MGSSRRPKVSVLFNEPKLLKSDGRRRDLDNLLSFSALQRAEIAEISPDQARRRPHRQVSVLFNEPKLLKSIFAASTKEMRRSFSALQRAEIAEMC